MINYINPQRNPETGDYSPLKEWNIPQPNLSDLYVDITNITKDMYIKSNYGALAYSFMFNMIDRVFTTAVSTFAIGVEGINYKTLINPYFYSSLNRVQKAFVVSHEMNHVFLGHCLDSTNYSNQQLHNIATDLYINTILLYGADGKQKTCFPMDAIPHCYDKVDWETNILPQYQALNSMLEAKKITQKEYLAEISQLPVRAVHPDDYDNIITVPEILNRGSDYIYNLLLEQESKNQKNNQGNNDGNGWDFIVSLTQNEGDHPSQHKDQEKNKNLPEGAKNIIQGQMDNLSKEALEQAIAAMKSIGNIPNHLKGVYEKLTRVPPPITNWRTVFNNDIRSFGNFTEITRTRTKPNLIIPDTFRLKLSMSKHLALVFDTSGSVSQPELIDFFTEALNISKITGFKLTIIECDAYVNSEIGVYELMNIEQISKRLSEGLVTGGGGTSFDPAIKFLNEELEEPITGVVYFTDGYVPTPRQTLHLPLKVVISSNGIKDNQLENFAKEWNVGVLKIDQDYKNK